MLGLRDILLPTMEIGLEDIHWYKKEVPEVIVSVVRNLQSCTELMGLYRLYRPVHKSCGL